METYGAWIITVMLLLGIIIIWLAVGSWLQSRKLWNGGYSPDGNRWKVRDIDGTLYLMTSTRIVKVPGVMVYGPIADEAI